MSSGCKLVSVSLHRVTKSSRSPERFLFNFLLRYGGGQDRSPRREFVVPRRRDGWGEGGFKQVTEPRDGRVAMGSYFFFVAADPTTSPLCFLLLSLGYTLILFFQCFFNVLTSCYITSLGGVSRRRVIPMVSTMVNAAGYYCTPTGHHCRSSHFTLWRRLLVTTDSIVVSPSLCYRRQFRTSVENPWVLQHEYILVSHRSAIAGPYVYVLIL